MNCRNLLEYDNHPSSSVSSLPHYTIMHAAECHQSDSKDMHAAVCHQSDSKDMHAAVCHQSDSKDMHAAVCRTELGIQYNDDLMVGTDPYIRAWLAGQSFHPGQ